jgi:hypothetical protein
VGRSVQSASVVALLHTPGEGSNSEGIVAFDTGVSWELLCRATETGTKAMTDSEETGGTVDRGAPTRSRTLEKSDRITATVEGAMRRLAVIARVVGWAWMLMLVVATLKVDAGADPVIVVAAMVLASVWTAISVWASRSRRSLALSGSSPQM